VDVRVEPRGGFHISQDFPTELRVNPVDGVTLARPVLAPAQAAEFTEQRAHFRVAMTPTRSGHRHVTGVFRFAQIPVSPSSCLPERRTIEWDVVAQ
jgi:hypothetical protein